MANVNRNSRELGLTISLNIKELTSHCEVNVSVRVNRNEPAHRVWVGPVHVSARNDFDFFLTVSMFSWTVVRVLCSMGLFC